MPNPNTLLFDVADLEQATWQLCTKPQSLSFGRQLYQLQYADQCYWLKLQFKNVHQVTEQNYLNELNFYFHWHNQLSCLLPMQQLDLSDQPQFQHTYTSVLMPHAEPWLSCAEDLSILNIQAKILAMLDSIDELAQLGLIHADLKQEHFVNWQGQLKLLDFEQVQSFDTVKKNLSATPRYMAPELFHGEAKNLQTDLYALGIILYEWLTGQRLYAARYIDWAYLHCQYLDIQLPKSYQCFGSVIHGLTAKHKQARFSDIQTVKQAVQQLIC
jgi:serine/threonine protein kinase